MSGIIIRRAEPGDAAGMARIQVDSWRDAYRDIVDPGYLSALSLAAVSDRFRERLAQGSAGHRVIACLESEIVGYCAVSIKIDAPYEGEWFMHALYVHPSRQHQGVGKVLLDSARDEGKLRHQSRMIFGVFTANQGAKAFYERCGSRFIEQGTFELEGISYPTDYCEYLL